jgi:hypothetical protein
MNATELNNFARHYVEALFFTNAGPDDEIPADAELSESALETIAADCAKFEEQMGETIDAAECTRGSGEYTQREQAAHDFWMTRNGHGVGFWDGDWSEPHASKLDDAAKAFGECQPYLGDDGLIYLA